MIAPDPSVGQRWAYRARSIDRVVEVEVLKVGTKRPPRIQVRFVDEAQEGREEWVSPARLKVLWEHAEAWQHSQDQWEAAREASGVIRDTTEDRAAWFVEEALPPLAAVELGYNRDAGLMFITDVEAICGELGLTAEDLQHPAAFEVGDQLVVPWPVTEKILQGRAIIHADVLLTELHKREQEAERGLRWGRDSGYGTYYDPEFCAVLEAEDRPARELVRRWCGADAVERADELLALREEVRRLGHIAEQAITGLRNCGGGRLADRLERELGVPVEEIRASREHDDRQRASGP